MCPAFLKIQVLPKSNRIGCGGAGGGVGGSLAGSITSHYLGNEPALIKDWAQETAEIKPRGMGQKSSCPPGQFTCFFKYNYKSVISSILLFQLHVLP